MKLIILSLFIFIVVNQSLAVDEVPVLIYSKNAVPSDFDTVKIANQLNTEEFSNKLNKLFPNSFKKLAVISLENLKSQDIVFNINQYISKGHQANLVYFPAVQSPVNTLGSFRKSKHDGIDVTKVGSLKNAFETLNNFMILDQYEGVIVTSSFDDRKRRQAGSIITGDNSNVQHVITGDQCMAVFNQTSIANASTTLTYLNFTTGTFVCTTNQTAVLTLNFQPGDNPNVEYLTQLTFNFTRSTRYWVNLNNTATTTFTNKKYALKYTGLPYGFETPFKYSYACTKSRFLMVSINKDGRVAPTSKVEIIINALQIQPFQTAINQTYSRFGPVNYCSGFFTNGIWMGIFTTLLLAAILAGGLMTLTSVNTMDRFDDPKGKQLVIAAEK